jgi:hypothetical protein
MKSFSVEFRRYASSESKSHKHRGRSHQDEYISATVLAVNAADACRVAEDYRKRLLPKFELAESRPDNNLVIMENVD